MTVTRLGEILRVVIADDGRGGADPSKGSGLKGLAQRVRSVDGTFRMSSPRGPDDDERGAAVPDVRRAVIAEDSVLLRIGLVKVVEMAGFEVAAEAGNAQGLLTAVEEHRPDIAVVDVRMPPGFTDEGVRAALAIRRSGPALRC